MTCAKKGAKKIEEKSRSELLEDKCEIVSRSVEEQLFQMQIRGEPRRDHLDLAAWNLLVPDESMSSRNTVLLSWEREWKVEKWAYRENYVLLRRKKSGKKLEKSLKSKDYLKIRNSRTHYRQWSCTEAEIDDGDGHSF